MIALLATHAALVAAVAAVGATGARIAASAGARGLELLVGAAVVAAAVAGIEALTLGLVALGGSPVALTAAAALTYAGVAARLPPSGAGGQAAAWWGGLDGRERALLGAAAGAAGAWVAWLVRDPALGIDPLSYHLPESVMWVQQGTPGSVELITYEFPQGNYPVTNELLVAWLTGIGRSLAPGLLWTPATGVLLAAAGWLGLRRLGAPSAAAGLAIAGVLLVPVAATQHLGPHTDLPALAWLAACAALATRPATLPLALLAGALAVGTKTTVAPLAVAVLAVAAVAHLRGRPGPARGMRRGLALAGLAGLAVGGAWYVRNLVDHGSPLWPFVALPWGDEVPRFLDAFDVSFLDRPGATLEGRAGAYVDLLGGGLLLLAGGLLAPLLHARRAVAAAAGAAALALLAWLNAPFTGAPEDPVFDLSLTTTRYLLPAVAAAAAALALAAGRAGEGRRTAAVALLAIAAAVSLQRSLALPAPGIPGLGLLAGGALAGALVLSRLPAPGRAAGRAAAAGAALAAAAALTVTADGFGRRHGGVGSLASSGVAYWMATQPRFTEGSDPVAFAPQMIATLAGDRLRHPIEMIPAGEACARTLARDGWLVIGSFPFPERRQRFRAADCVRDLAPVYADRFFRVYFLG